MAQVGRYLVHNFHSFPKHRHINLRKLPFSSSRWNSTSSSATSINLPSQIPTSGAVDLSPLRGFLALQGSDVPKFLQGLITKIFPSETEPVGMFTSFLSPQGRVLFDAFIYTVDPSFLGSDSEFGKWDPIHIIEVDRSLLPNLKTHLNRYKLRSRFHIHDIPERRLQLYSVWPDLEWHQEIFSQAVTITDPRSVNLGTRVLTSQTPPIDPSKLQQLEVYHIRRTLHGVPEGPEEILEGQALPAESNLDVLSGIDYTKGCYVGQELTSRTYHTGVIRKRLLPMSLYPSNGEVSEPQTLEWNPSVKVELPPSGTPLGVQGEKRSPGKFLRGWGNLGWGLCRLDYVGRVLQCQWEGGIVNVKPFLPEWGPFEKEVEAEEGVA